MEVLPAHDLLVTHDTHDVVTIRDEAETDGESNDSNLPQWHRGFRSDSLTSRPGRVHGSPDTNSVTDIVGSVSKGCGAGGDDLNKRVEILDLVLVLGCVFVHTFHAATFWSAQDTELRLVNIVVHTVESGDDNHCREALHEGFHVVYLVDGTCTWWVAV